MLEAEAVPREERGDCRESQPSQRECGVMDRVKTGREPNRTGLVFCFIIEIRTGLPEVSQGGCKKRDALQPTKSISDLGACLVE